MFSLVNSTKDLLSRGEAFLIFSPKKDDIAISYFELPLDDSQYFQLWYNTEVGLPDDLEELYTQWYCKAISNTLTERILRETRSNTNL